MGEDNTKHGRFRIKSGGFFIAAATCAFFLSPMLNLASPFYLLIGGLILSVGVMSKYEKDVLNDKSGFTAFMAKWGVLGSYLLLVCVFSQAIYVDAERSKTCAILQESILNGNDKIPILENGRPAPHDAFSALGCRYQSEYLFGFYKTS